MVNPQVGADDTSATDVAVVPAAQESATSVETNGGRPVSGQLANGQVSSMNNGQTRGDLTVVSRPGGGSPGGHRSTGRVPRRAAASGPGRAGRRGARRRPGPRAGTAPAPGGQRFGGGGQRPPVIAGQAGEEGSVAGFAGVVGVVPVQAGPAGVGRVGVGQPERPGRPGGCRRGRWCAGTGAGPAGTAPNSTPRPAAPGPGSARGTRRRPGLIRRARPPQTTRRSRVHVTPYPTRRVPRHATRRGPPWRDAPGRRPASWLAFLACAR